MATLVYRYGIRSRDDSQRWQVPAEVDEQMRLAHRMRNALVELEHAHEQAMRDLWSQWPDVARVEADLAAAEQTAADLAERARAEHSADRSTATRPGTAAELRDARRKVRELRGARRAAIGEAYPQVKPDIERIRAERKAAIKKCRQEYASLGLYWATYNAVLADHATAVKLVDQRRRRGEPAQLRYHRWDGTGTISVQLQRVAGDPPRTPALLASGEGPWRNVLQVAPWMPPEELDCLPRAERKRVGRGTATINVGGGRNVVVPVQVHRMMPADADVCEAQLVVTRVAGQVRAHLCLTVKVGDPDPVQGPGPVAVHGGWRQRPDGSVRVGTWASPVPLEVPDTVADVVAAHDGGRWGEIILPASWLDVAGRPAALRSRRDLALEPVQRKLADWLDGNRQPDTDDRPGLTGADVRRWRSANRFAALAIRWRDNPPQGLGGGEINAVLEAWRRQDRHLWEWEAHERDQIGARRDDAWRRVGAWLAGRVGLLLVDDANLSELRRRQDVADDDPVMPGAAAQQARARAALAAPGRLRQLVAAAAVRRGVAVRQVESAHLTRTHRVCGHVADAHPRFAAAAVVTCPGCDGSYDQDHNAAMLMLDRERDGGAGSERGRSPA